MVKHLHQDSTLKPCSWRRAPEPPRTLYSSFSYLHKQNQTNQSNPNIKKKHYRNTTKTHKTLNHCTNYNEIIITCSDQRVRTQATERKLFPLSVFIL